MTAWELLLALPAARWIAGVCLVLGTVCGAGATLALTWRWRAHGPSRILLRYQLADARRQVRDLLAADARRARVYVEAKAGRP